MQKTALLIVDFQNDYFSTFKGAKFPLANSEEASLNVAEILNVCREKNMNIIHIRHEKDSRDAMFFKKGTGGAMIHKNVEPKYEEMVITKNYPNSFLKTELKEYLDKLDITSLIIVGAMTHMCIDATVRAASDFGYNCTVVEDACATKNLEFEGREIPFSYVHSIIMSALEFAYAKVVNTQNFLKELNDSES